AQRRQAQAQPRAGMSERKPSLVDRLFGRPPAPAGREPPPGPPETTPKYVERVEAGSAGAAAAPPQQGWLQRLTSGLRRSSDQLTQGIGAVFTKKKLDQAMLDELEDL